MFEKQRNIIIATIVVVLLVGIAIGVLGTSLYYRGFESTAQAASPEYVQVLDVIRVPVFIDTCSIPLDKSDADATRPVVVIIEEVVKPIKPNTPTVTPPTVVPPVEPPIVVPPTTETPKGNCGVGNGVDGDTPGCPNGTKDGEGFGPGHPGAQGGNGNGNAFGLTKEHTNNGKGKDK